MRRQQTRQQQRIPPTVSAEATKREKSAWTVEGTQANPSALPIEWNSADRQVRGTLPTFQLYRWSDLVRLSKQVGGILRRGAVDSSYPEGVGEASSRTDEVDEHEPEEQE